MISCTGKQNNSFEPPQFTESGCSPRWVVLLQAGPQEEGDRVKTKPVSCSTVGGRGVPVKRTSQHLAPEDRDEPLDDQPAPSKASKVGFSMSSTLAAKSNPISIKLGATVSFQKLQRVSTGGRQTPSTRVCEGLRHKNIQLFAVDQTEFVFMTLSGC